MQFSTTGLLLALGFTCGILASPVASLTQEKSSIEARIPVSDLACPPGVHCGPGPVCTINDCELCPTFPGCAAKKEKREAAEEVIHPVCDICDANGNCGCGTIFKDKRQAEKRIIDPICDICDANGNCGCGTIFKKKRNAEAAVQPICQVCTSTGCACQDGHPARL